VHSSRTHQAMTGKKWRAASGCPSLGNHNRKLSIQRFIEPDGLEPTLAALPVMSSDTFTTVSGNRPWFGVRLQQGEGYTLGARTVIALMLVRRRGVEHARDR